MPCCYEDNCRSSMTDFSGLSTYELTVKGREMSTPPTLLMEYNTLLVDNLQTFDTDNEATNVAGKK